MESNALDMILYGNFKTTFVAALQPLPQRIWYVAFDKAPERIQKIVDESPDEKYYCTDDYLGYIDVVYRGRHIRNARDKSDTFTVESIKTLPIAEPLDTDLSI